MQRSLCTHRLLLPQWTRLLAKNRKNLGPEISSHVLGHSSIL